MRKRLPPGPAVCAWKPCGKPFIRTTKQPGKEHCCKAHSELTYRDGKKKRSSTRSPRFLLAMLAEEEPGKCAFGCGNDVTRAICKDEECVSTYRRLYRAEKRADAKALARAKKAIAA